VFFGKKGETKTKRKRMEVTMNEGAKRKDEEKVQEMDEA
jgi:hypothetical protein